MFTRLLQGSLRTRFTRLIGVPSALFLLAVLGLTAQRAFRHAVEQTEISALQLARIHATRLDRALAEAARVPEMHARVFESGTLTDPVLINRYLTDVLTRTKGIYGTCLGFEPDSVIPGQKNYCPYAYLKDGKPEFTLLAPPEYDHFTFPWYNDPRRIGRALWTEPYFDDGGGNVLMTTRSVPFRKPNADGTMGDFWGVATIDISLDQLISGLNEVAVSQTGYALLLSPEGHILACPDKSKIMKVSMEQLSPALAKSMLPGMEGFVHTTDPLKSRDAWVAFTPVQTAGFTLALIYPTDEIFRDANQQLREMLLIAVLGVGALFLALQFIASSISTPVTQLASATRNIADGDLSQNLEDGGNITEVRDLTLAFKKMTGDLKMRMEELKYTTTLKERMEGELNAARRIQMSMLPREWADRADWSGNTSIALHAIIQPAREVGGDFYDYRFLDQDRLSILIGDVSGKGVPAALFMAMTQTLFQAHASPEGTVSNIMARVNNALCEEAHTGMFVTLLYAELNVRTGMLEICNAGHLPPYLIPSGKGVGTLNSQRNPALGLVPDFNFTSASFLLHADDTLFLYTDGVTEAFNATKELYGHQRLENLLMGNAVKSVEDLTQAVITAVQYHSINMEATDDLTVLAVKFSGSGAT